VSLFIADDTLTPSTSSPGFSAELVATFVKKALACMGGGTAQPTKVTPLMVSLHESRGCAGILCPTSCSC
jgi:hypothetical protein